ncbi:MAG: hypothetical protein TYPL_4610 [Candidatus Tyloplasma litorale]|nr:MAG: hypothetical protein TYPL_4610 [Mycoplasmatales bacterium]
MKPFSIRDLLQKSASKPKQKGLTKEELEKSLLASNNYCDDLFQIYIKIENNIVSKARFEGGGCAISISSVDILLKLIEGKEINEINNIINVYEGFLNSKISTTGYEILDIFKIVHSHKSRVKCATIPIETIRKVIKNKMNKILDIDFSYSNITNEEKDVLKNRISDIHNSIRNRTGEGNEFMDWLNWPKEYDKKEVQEMIGKVSWMKKEGIETLLVIGIGGSFLGAQSAIDFIKGKMNKQDEIIFAGINMSSSHIVQIEQKLQNKKWGICVISKSGTTLEPALSFRYFKKLLEKKEGIKAKDYIVAITDGNKGALKTLSNSKGYSTYVVPDGIGGRFSGITPVGLFPMLFADIDIKKVLKGAEKAMHDFSKLEDNTAYEYAQIRYLLNNKYSKVAEIFTTYDFDLEMTSEWLKQLFGESEGKNGKGIMPNSVTYSRDLHSLGQIIQEGFKNFFETTIWINKDENPIIVEKDDSNLDGLNYLVGKSFHEINKKAFDGVLKAHHEQGGTPNIIIKLQDRSEETLGYLWYFFFIVVTMSAYLNGVNPFNQPGVELYKKNMFQNLKEE